MLHNRLGGAVLLWALTGAAWGLWAHWQKRELPGDYWGLLIVGEVAVLLQGASGLIILGSGAQPARGVHLLYGVLSACVWPLAWVYARDHPATEGASYSLASFLLAALSIRAMMTV